MFFLCLLLAIAVIIMMIIVLLNLETTVNIVLRLFEKIGLTHRTHHWDDVE